METNKDRAPRFKIEQAITIELTRERFIHAEGINLSETGMLLKTDTEVEPMTGIYLMFTIPYGAPKDSPKGDPSQYRIICEGSVVRVDKHGDEFKLGIQFSSLENEDKIHLTGYLGSLTDRIAE